MSYPTDLKSQAQAAVVALKATNPQDANVLASYIKALLNKDVVALGSHEAFALTDGSGRIVATRRVVELTAENGGLTQPVWAGPFTISAPGYTMLAEAAGAVVMNAKTVIVDGVEQQNPYVRRDSRQNIIEVYCRAIAFRYNEQGQPCVSDRTTIFDLATYMMADMVGKAKKTPQAFSLLPSDAPTPGQGWAKYEIDGVAALWLNLGHEEARTFLGQVLNRKKKAMEFAQTFAQRNALKHLFGLSVVPGQGQGRECRPIPFWQVPVTCWRPMDGGVMRFDSAKYEQATIVLDAVAAGRPAPALSAGEAPMTLTMPAQVSVGVDHVDGESAEAVDPEEMHNAQPYDGDTGEVYETEALPQEEVPAEAPQAPVGNDEQEKAWANLQVARENFPDQFVEATDNLGLASQGITPANAARIVQEMNRLMDAEAA